MGNKRRHSSSSSDGSSSDTYCPPSCCTFPPQFCPPEPLYPKDCSLKSRRPKVRPQNKCKPPKLPQVQAPIKNKKKISLQESSSIDCPDPICSQSSDCPDDCCCCLCMKRDKSSGDSSIKLESKTKMSKTVNLSSSGANQTLKNYLYDNPTLKEIKYKKSSSCCENIDSSDEEVWLLQVPKSFDTKKMICGELKKLIPCAGEPEIDACAERFCEKKILTMITPQKLAEYEAVCDTMKLIKPVGKIVITEKCPTMPECCPPPHCEIKSENDYDDSDNEEVCKPIAAKKIRKKINDQRFTIETTVTVENCDKKNHKSKKSNKNDCPPPSCSINTYTKKSKRLKCCDDTSWLN